MDQELQLSSKEQRVVEKLRQERNEQKQLEEAAKKLLQERFARWLLASDNSSKPGEEKGLEELPNQPETEIKVTPTSFNPDTEIVRSYERREHGRLSLLYEFVQNAIDYNDWSQGPVSLTVTVGSKEYSLVELLALDETGRDDFLADCSQARQFNKPLFIQVKNAIRPGGSYSKSKLIDIKHEGVGQLGTHGIGSKAAGACGLSAGWLDTVTMESVDEMGRGWKGAYLLGVNPELDKKSERLNIGFTQTTEKPLFTTVKLQNPDIDLLKALFDLPGYFLPLNPNYDHNAFGTKPEGQGMVRWGFALEAQQAGEKNADPSEITVWRKVEGQRQLTLPSGVFEVKDSEGKPVVFSEHPRVEVLRPAEDADGKKEAYELQETIMVDGVQLKLEYNKTLLPYAVWGFGQKGVRTNYQVRRSQDSSSIARLSPSLLQEVIGQSIDPLFFEALFSRFFVLTARDDQGKRMIAEHYWEPTELFVQGGERLNHLIESDPEVKKALVAGALQALAALGVDSSIVEVADTDDEYTQAVNLDKQVIQAPSDFWKQVLVNHVGLKKVDTASLMSEAKKQPGTISFSVSERKGNLSSEELELLLLERLEVVNRLLLLLYAFEGTLQVVDNKVVLTFSKELPKSAFVAVDKKNLTDLKDLNIELYLALCKVIGSTFNSETIQANNERTEPFLQVRSPSPEDGYKVALLSLGNSSRESSFGGKYTTYVYVANMVLRHAPQPDALLQQAPGLQLDQPFMQIVLDYSDIAESNLFEILKLRWEKVGDAQTGRLKEAEFLSSVGDEAIKQVTAALKKFLEHKTAETAAIEKALGLVQTNPSATKAERQLNQLAEYKTLSGNTFANRAYVPLLSTRGLMISVPNSDSERKPIKELLTPIADKKNLNYQMQRLKELTYAFEHPDIEPLNLSKLPKGSDSKTLLYGYGKQRDGQSWRSSPAEYASLSQPTELLAGVRLNLPVMRGEYMLVRYPGMAPIGLYHPDAEVVKGITLKVSQEGTNYALKSEKDIPAGLEVYFKEAKDTAMIRPDDSDTLGFDFSTNKEKSSSLFATKEQEIFFRNLKNNQSIDDSQKAAAVLFFWKEWFIYNNKEQVDSQNVHVLSQAAQHSIREGTGVCFEAAAGLMLLFRMVGLKARLVTACAGDFNGFFPELGLHAVVDVLADHKWVTVEPQRFEGAVLSHTLELEKMPFRLKTQIRGLTRGRESLRNGVASLREELATRQDIPSIITKLNQTVEQIAGSPELALEMGEEELASTVMAMLKVLEALREAHDSRLAELNAIQARDLAEAQAKAERLSHQLRLDLERLVALGASSPELQQLLGTLRQVDEIGDSSRRPEAPPPPLTIRSKVGLWLLKITNRLLAPQATTLSNDYRALYEGEVGAVAAVVKQPPKSEA